MEQLADAEQMIRALGRADAFEGERDRPWPDRQAKGRLLGRLATPAMNAAYYLTQVSGPVQPVELFQQGFLVGLRERVAPRGIAMERD